MKTAEEQRQRVEELIKEGLQIFEDDHGTMDAVLEGLKSLEDWVDEIPLIEAAENGP